MAVIFPESGEQPIRPGKEFIPGRWHTFLIVHSLTPFFSFLLAPLSRTEALLAEMGAMA
jgi:hypothetical protein